MFRVRGIPMAYVIVAALGFIAGALTLYAVLWVAVLWADRQCGDVEA